MHTVHNRDWTFTLFQVFSCKVYYSAGRTCWRTRRWSSSAASASTSCSKLPPAVFPPADPAPRTLLARRAACLQVLGFLWCSPLRPHAAPALSSAESVTGLPPSAGSLTGWLRRDLGFTSVAAPRARDLRVHTVCCFAVRVAGGPAGGLESITAHSLDEPGFRLRFGSSSELSSCMLRAPMPSRTHASTVCLDPGLGWGLGSSSELRPCTARALMPF